MYIIYIYITLSDALQETKGRTETIRRTDHNELLSIAAKVDRKNIGGVGFLVNSTVHHLVDSYKIISPRVAVLRLETKDQETISIINGYAPTSAATDEEKEEFYKLFERTVKDEKSYYKVVVGDFNATVGTNDHDEWSLGPQGTPSRNENGAVPSMEMSKKPSNRRWTWESPNGETRSEIDHVLANRRWSLFDVSVLLSFDTGSDHRLVRAKLTLKKRMFERDTHKPAPVRIPTFKLRSWNIQ
ncbi:unnamed protein product [Heligmosomoides polygyrus]|uniref:Endo/exonuclease/phosphatase domain-containing protein n=1 Tax=Heligmosomoides polygyrus TaxID=6339 RepID=A0A183FLA3_HELPZ|nr:unnamed protein product [Heligmosomoides polygyrus]